MEDNQERILALLQRRAERLRTPTVTKPPSLLAAELWVGDERYALPLEKLRAVLPLRLVTPVPLSSSKIIGLYRFEGRLVTAFSFASLVGVRGWLVDPELLLLVEVSPGRLVALDCEQVPREVELPLEKIERPKETKRQALLRAMTQELYPIWLVEDLAALVDSALKQPGER
jgi:chemotaxis signal transduction protein